MTTSIRRRITDIACASPTGTAIVGFDAALTEQLVNWRELADAVHGIADSLHDMLDHRDTPCVVVPASNTPHAAITIAGVLAAEFPLFPMDPTAPPAERDRVLGFLARRFRSVLVLDGDRRLCPVDGPADIVAGTPSRPAYLLATGGSSGLPKIAIRSGPLAYDPARTPSLAIRQTGWRTGQRQLVVGPLYHAAPFTVFLDALLDNNTVVLQPLFSPAWTVRLIGEYGIEWLQLTPTHMREILLLGNPSPDDFRTVRSVLHTAAHCDPGTKRSWLDLLGPDRLYELYGATEHVGITLVRGDEWLARPGTVGRGVLTQIAILDEDRRPVPPGTVGTVFMRTPQGLRQRGYVGDRTVETTVDGFATVGDRGWLDRDGYLFLEPRQHGVINVGGEKVDPSEVEAAVLDHPDVLDAVAVGVPHETLGSVVGVRVAVRPHATVSRRDMVAHCGQRLAGHKIPKSIEFVTEIPRSASGKIQRWRLYQD